MYELYGVDLRIYTTHEIHNVIVIERPAWKFPIHLDDNGVDMAVDWSGLKWWIDDFETNSFEDLRISLKNKNMKVF